MLVALSADVFFRIVRIIRRSYRLGAAVLRLFSDTEINSAAGGAIGIVCVEKANSLNGSRKNDTSELLLF